MAKVLEIQIRVNDDGSVAINKVANALGHVEKKAGAMSVALGAAGGVIAGMFTVQAVERFVTALGGMVKTGFAFNSQMEQSKIGLTALVAQFGGLAEGTGKWNAAGVIAVELQDKLKIAALKTTATYSEMISALQIGLAPAMKAGFNPDQVVEFTKTVTQAAGAIGLPFAQLGQEIRALFAGDIGPDSRLANLLFSDIPRDKIKAYVAELQRSGKFFDEMMKRMASFAQAGDELGNTLTGAWSNLGDAFQQALGEATSGQLSSITGLIKDLTKEIVTFDEAGNATFNQDFVDGVRALADAFAYLAKKIASITISVTESLPALKEYFHASNEAMEVRARTLKTPSMWGAALFEKSYTVDDALARRAQERMGKERYAQWLDNFQFGGIGTTGRGEGEFYGTSSKPGGAGTVVDEDAIKAALDAAKKAAEAMKKLREEWDKQSVAMARAAELKLLKPFAASLKKLEWEMEDTLKKMKPLGAGVAASIKEAFAVEEAGLWATMLSESAQRGFGKLFEAAKGVEAVKLMLMQVNPEIVKADLAARKAEAATAQWTEALTDMRSVMAGNFVDDFLSSLQDGTFDIGDLFKDLVADIGGMWTNMLANMVQDSIKSGKSISTALKDMNKAINEGTTLDKMIAGVGIGSMIGGIGGVAAPGTRANEGGMIGGAIGGIWGPVGAIVGALIGTIAGSFISVGKDQIVVAIKDNIAKVTATGLDTEQTRKDLERDVNRKIKDLSKDYENLIDAFPRALQARIRSLVGKVGLGFDFKSAEGAISDAGAMGAISQLMDERLPQAVWAAYRRAIEVGLGALGVNAKRLEQMMAEWGTLQGKELADSVRSYVLALVDAMEVSALFSEPGSFTNALAAGSKLANQTPLTQMVDLQGEIALMVASLSELDLEEQIVAVNQITALGRKRYEMEIAYLAQIDRIQKSIVQSIDAQIKGLEYQGLEEAYSVDAAGNRVAQDDPNAVKMMSPQLDWVYEQMRKLREQLLASTNPEDIQRITAEIQSYASQVLALIPKDLMPDVWEQTRQNLITLLEETRTMAEKQLAEARAAVQAEHEKTAMMLQEAARALMVAAESLRDRQRGVTRPPTEEIPTENPNKPGHEPFTPTNTYTDGWMNAMVASQGASEAYLKRLVSLAEKSADDGGIQIAVTPSGEFAEWVDVSVTNGSNRARAGAVGDTIDLLRRDPDIIRSYT